MEIPGLKTLKGVVAMNQQGSGTNQIEANESTFRRLRYYNFGMGILHLIQGILMFIISSDFSLPISTLYLQFNVETTSLTQNLQTIGDIRLGPLVAGFLFISALAHFFVSTFGFNIYNGDLKQ